MGGFCNTQTSLGTQRSTVCLYCWRQQVRSLGQEDTLEEETATHSSILAWRIPWPEDPGRLQPIGSPRVGHD